MDLSMFPQSLRQATSSMDGKILLPVLGMVTLGGPTNVRLVPEVDYSATGRSRTCAIATVDIPAGTELFTANYAHGASTPWHQLARHGSKVSVHDMPSECDLSDVLPARVDSDTGCGISLPEVEEEDQVGRANLGENHFAFETTRAPAEICGPEPKKPPGVLYFKMMVKKLSS